ncbi:MAG TPA: TonB family protein, partial [Kofleriaceae bacterium]|nr:TonB family protein [Kofleriaceae bacterium]
DPITMPSRYRSDVPPQLDAIVARALARNPAHRFATADEMRSALDDLAASLPKVDARVIARSMEDLFGTIRAQAMCSIAQSRALSHNISLVMKRPQAIPVSRSPVAWLPTLEAPVAGTGRRRLILAGAAAGAIGIGVIAGLATRGSQAQPAAGSAQPAPAAIAPAVAPSVAAAEPTPPTTIAPPAPPPTGESGAVPVTGPRSAPPPAPGPEPAAPPTTAGPEPSAPPRTAGPEPAAPPDPPVAPPPTADPSRGTLTVTAPASAVISLDGAVIERGSFAERATGTGRHRLVINVPGRRPVTRSIVIEANRETRVDIEPQRAIAVREPARPPRGSSSGANGEASDARSPAEGAAHTPPRPRAADGKSRAEAAKPRADAEKPDTAATAPAKPAVDLAAVRAAARSQLAPVLQCYERGKMDDNNLRGNVTVRITIAADGSVASAQVASSTLGAPQVEACITHEVARWQLPGPADGVPVSLSYPFVFE